MVKIGPFEEDIDVVVEIAQFSTTLKLVPISSFIIIC